MNFNSLIIDTLKPLGVPVSFLTYTGESRPYIVFQELDQRSSFDSDDVEEITNHFIQLDVFHTGNYTSLVESVKASLKAIGFTRQSEQDLYEPDTKLYHKVLRFNYFIENGED